MTTHPDQDDDAYVINQDSGAGDRPDSAFPDPDVPVHPTGGQGDVPSDAAMNARAPEDVPPTEQPYHYRSAGAGEVDGD